MSPRAARQIRAGILLARAVRNRERLPLTRVADRDQYVVWRTQAGARLPNLTVAAYLRCRDREPRRPPPGGSGVFFRPG